MEGPRQPLEKEYAEILNFLKQELRPNTQWSVASEYPTALSFLALIQKFTSSIGLDNHANNTESLGQYEQ